MRERTPSMLLTVLVTSAALGCAGCYLSHRRAEDGGPIDGGPVGDAGIDAGADAGMDAGADAGPPTCCVNWGFERRVTVEGFGDQTTVTPRLIELSGAPAIVVTGPSDPIGPSGAHLIRLSRYLTTQSVPVPVTSGSFTWGQPVSSGDRFAVCWGTDGGRNVVRIYDAVGEPVSDIITLDDRVWSPCLGAAYSERMFAFAYAHRTPDGASEVRARLLDAPTLMLGGGVDVWLPGDATSASIVGTRNGFALAVAGSEFPLVVFERTGVGRVETRIESSQRAQLVPGVEGFQLLRVMARAISPARVVDLWLRQSFDDTTLSPAGPEVEVAHYDPSPSPLFDATVDACGSPMLGTSVPSLIRVNSSGGITEFLPTAPSPGTLRGDTSVLVLGNDAYVAFSAGSLNSRAQIDHYVCMDD